MKRTWISILAAMALVAALPSRVLADPTESEVEAPGPQGPLKGLMVRVDKPDAPLVLIIPGSGPVDRDGNIPYALSTDTYKLLAHALAAHGIASVRIDKRGMNSSAAAIPNPNDVTIADYASDVHTWASAILKQTGGKCIWVLGHSEGGLVAMAAAKDNPRDICGLLLVAAPGRPFSELIKDQMRSNPSNAPILDQALHDIDELAAGRRVDMSNAPPQLAPIFPAAVQGFLIDLFSYDPPKLLAAFKGRVLILQGEHDIEVSVNDAHRLAAADSNAKLVLLPNVNHVLKTVTSDDPKENLKPYFNPGLPIDPSVTQAITDFITTPKSP